MSATQPSLLIYHLRRMALAGAGAGVADGHLLSCYLERRDEGAFAALVHRHGPMVWGVCYRVLRNLHDAEDAFQAVFLVLARKAACVRPREKVANWLYGVAFTTAHRAKVTAARRRARETQVRDLPEPAMRSADPWSDLQPVLDQELSRLPEKYRTPILVCDLEGKTRKEAARQLGVPEGTVAGRLARARVLLAKRLARHGLAVSGGALAMLLSKSALSAKMPAVSITVKAASLFAAGRAARGFLSTEVAALAEGVLKAMLASKVKTGLTLLMVMAFIDFGLALGVRGLMAAEQDDGRKQSEEQAAAVKQVEPPVTPADGDGLKSVVYPVAEIVVTLVKQKKQDIDENAQTLERLITSMLYPDSWSKWGGRGTIRYIPDTMSLAVVQTPKIHKDIADLLSVLRRRYELEVQLEVGLLAVPESFLRRLETDIGDKAIRLPQQSDKTSDEKLHVAFVDEQNILQLCKRAEVDQRIKTSFMKLPRVTLFDGQTGEITVRDSELAGLRFKAQPVVSADRRFVRTEFEFEISEETADVPPRCNTQRVRVTFSVPDGRSGMLCGLKTTSTQVLGKISRGQTFHPEARRLLVLITPRILVNQGNEQPSAKPIPSPKAEPRQSP